jgi:phospholipid/cholesterol/gamma-HCH transport system permease protein
MHLCALTYRLAAIAVGLPRIGRALIKRVIVEQVYFTAVQALPVIIPVALITGSMLIVQFSQLSGQVDLGKLLLVVVVLVLREIGPLITAIIVTCLYHGLARKNQITQVPVATSIAAVDCIFSTAW